MRTYKITRTVNIKKVDCMVVNVPEQAVENITIEITDRKRSEKAEMALIAAMVEQAGPYKFVAVEGATTEAVKYVMDENEFIARATRKEVTDGDNEDEDSDEYGDEETGFSDDYFDEEVTD